MADPEVYIDWGRGPDYTAVRCRSAVSMSLVHSRGLLDSWAITIYCERFPTLRRVYYCDLGVMILWGGHAHMVSEWILSERIS